MRGWCGEEGGVRMRGGEDSFHSACNTAEYDTLPLVHDETTKQIPGVRIYDTRLSLGKLS